MKETPILFSAPMVKAILAGTKRQTRRIVKPQPPTIEAVMALSGADFGLFGGRVQPDMFRPSGPVWAVREAMGREPEWRCPYGAAGDRLWVRQKTRVLAVGGGVARVRYESTGEVAEVPYPDRLRPARVGKCLAYGGHREASGITLEVTGVRVERLQEITEEDARAEGAPVGEMIPATINGERGRVMIFEPRKAFSVLWDSINGKRAPWANNPWVWVISFRRVQP